MKKVNLMMPGDVFAMAIAQITGYPPGTCGRCMQRQKTMNEWGWWKCWLNRKIITDWLVSEAKMRGHEVDEKHVLSLLKATWKELWKASTNTMQTYIVNKQIKLDAESAQEAIAKCDSEGTVVAISVSLHPTFPGASGSPLQSRRISPTPPPV